MNNDRHSWADVAAARIPAAGLAALGPVRCRPGVAVIRVAGFWVKFHPGDGELIRILLPLAGVEFFALRGGLWARFDQRLPTADGRRPTAGRRWTGSSSRAGQARRGAAGDRTGRAADGRAWRSRNRRRPCVLPYVLRGGPTRLRRRTWPRCATARCDDRAVLLGDRLPLVLGGERFWGKRVGLPVGFRPEPTCRPTCCGPPARAEPAEMPASC